MNKHRSLLGIATICVVVTAIDWQVNRSATVAYAQQPASQTQSQSPVGSPPEAGVFKSQAKLVLIDSVVTDKQGNYIRDLTQKDFRVWEDNKEQAIKSFSYESEDTSANKQTKHYLVLFFDNSTMDFSEQARARLAAAKFIDANAGPNRLIALVDFGGALRITQNFTSDADRLKAMVSGTAFSAVSPNAQPPAGVPSLMNVQGDFGARNMLLAVRQLAKNLTAVPGRKSLVLLSSGFPLTPERESELSAVIDACNKSNVAVYPIDARGLATFGTSPASGARGAHMRNPAPTRSGHLRTAVLNNYDDGDQAPHLLYVQHKPPPPPPPPPPPRNNPNRNAPSPPPGIVPHFPETASTNQGVLYALADGTGGFIILNTNDLLGGMERIAKEQSEYYILAYTPPDSPDRSCHVLKVRVDRTGVIVRSRSGYCNTKPLDLLAGKPIERELESHATSGQAGSVSGSLEAPFFFTSANVARVNLAMEVPSNFIEFEKEKGKFHSDV